MVRRAHAGRLGLTSAASAAVGTRSGISVPSAKASVAVIHAWGLDALAAPSLVRCPRRPTSGGSP